ncbi:MAG: hypothetical protein Q9166_006207 [cf. Caloplaca sp. 2 TL-2023]
MSFSSTAETLTNMGNLCSTPSTTCCKRPCPFPPGIRRHARGCKRIKYTLVPQRDPDRQRRRAEAIANNSTANGSPNTLHRSNAVRRPGHSRSQSSSPQGAHQLRLQVRNVTPPPPRPTSIVPTLMLIGTPSTGPTSVSRSIAPTIPTSPTTVVSGSFNYSSSSGSAGRSRTLYMVDGEIIGGDEERLELRWIDALRAPGAPGGYRTVVDVVEERRSGRLTVVNGGGRGSEESMRSRPYPSRIGRGGDSIDGIFAPRSGTESYRFTLEEGTRGRRQQDRQQQQRQTKPTPPKRKPVPATRVPTPDNPLSPRPQEPVIPSDHHSIIPTSEMAQLPQGPAFHRRGRAPMSRPPIPAFKPRAVTERELLDEVEDARRILDNKDKKRGNGEEMEEEGSKNDHHQKNRKEEMKEKKEGKKGRDREEQGDQGERKEKKKEGEGEEEGGMMDFFWVDESGRLKYKRCGLPI